jgi:hypothetical protein
MTQKLVIAAAAIAFIVFVISRQVRRRRVTPRGLTVLPVWFAALSVLADHRMVYRLHTAVAIGFFAAGVVFAGIMGVARAQTLRVWHTPDGPFCEGGWYTGALWFGTIAVRAGLFVLAARMGAVEGAGEAMLFVAVTLGVQNVLIARRAGLLPTAAGRAPALREVPVTERIG